jgi:hypothetical protein
LFSLLFSLEDLNIKVSTDLIHWPLKTFSFFSELKNKHKICSSSKISPTHSPDSSDNILLHIKCQNENQRVFNVEQFGPITNETILITIQVHKRLPYLLHLIDSLRAAASISKTLLIISHDVYNETINEALYRTIDFCMYTQIFFPFSIQTHPLTFPGDSPNDCSRDVTKKEAFDLNCDNKQYPDMYGHYRESSVSKKAEM